MRRDRFASVLMYLTEIVRLLINLFLSIYVIRELSVEQYGTYKFVNSFIAVFGYIFAWGFEDTLTRFLPEFISKNQNYRVHQLVSLFLSIRSTAIILLAVFIEVFKGSFLDFFNLSHSLISVTLAISLVIFFSKTYSLFGISVLSAFVEQHQINFFKLFQNIFKFFLFFYVISNDLGVNGLIVSLALLEMFGFIYFLILYIRKYLTKIKVNTSSTESSLERITNNKRIIKYASYSGMTNISNVFKETFVDNFFISHFGGVASVGHYGYGTTLLGILRGFNPVSILKNLYLPKLLIKYYALQDDLDRQMLLEFWYTLLTKVYIFIMIPLFILFMLYYREITIFIFDPKYLDTSLVVLILGSAFIIGDLVYTVDFIINIKEINRLYLYSEIFSFYNLIMDIILIAKFGIIGAALATGSTMILRSLYFQLAVRKLSSFKMTFPFKSAVKTFINLFPAIIFYQLFKHDISNVVILIFFLIISCVIYILMSKINGHFDPEESIIMQKIVGKRFWIF